MDDDVGRVYNQLVRQFLKRHAPVTRGWKGSFTRKAHLLVPELCFEARQGFLSLDVSRVTGNFRYESYLEGTKQWTWFRGREKIGVPCDTLACHKRNRQL